VAIVASPRALVALAQGAFYAAFGVWPVLHLASFEAVTGPKTDDWLVVTVGALLAVAGAALLVAGARREVAAPLPLLGAGTAAVLLTVDVVYVGNGTIGPIYLLDALAELAIVVAWVVAGRADATGAASPLVSGDRMR
jgi:hypothetical protein